MHDSGGYDNQLRIKFTFQRYCGHPTTFLFTKPLVTVFGDKIINAISDKCGNDHKTVQQRPPTAQMFGYS